MSIETDIAEIKQILAFMQEQMNKPLGSSKVYNMKDLLIAFKTTRRETVITRIKQLNIKTLPSKQVQVMEISLIKAGVI